MTLPRPLAGDWRDEFALIYDAALTRGITPAEVDELDLWVLAAALGANRARDGDPLEEDGLTWNQRRARALELGLPEPQWDDVPFTPAEEAALLRLSEDAQILVPPEEVSDA